MVAKGGVMSYYLSMYNFENCVLLPCIYIYIYIHIYLYNFLVCLSSYE